jgi:hypothetical protein
MNFLDRFPYVVVTAPPSFAADTGLRVPARARLPLLEWPWPDASVVAGEWVFTRFDPNAPVIDEDVPMHPMARSGGPVYHRADETPPPAIEVLPAYLWAEIAPLLPATPIDPVASDCAYLADLEKAFAADLPAATALNGVRISDWTPPALQDLLRAALARSYRLPAGSVSKFLGVMPDPAGANSPALDSKSPPQSGAGVLFTTRRHDAVEGDFARAEQVRIKKVRELEAARVAATPRDIDLDRQQLIAIRRVTSETDPSLFDVLGPEADSARVLLFPSYGLPWPTRPIPLGYSHEIITTGVLKGVAPNASVYVPGYADVLADRFAFALKHGVSADHKPFSRSYSADEFKYVRPNTVPARFALDQLRARAGQLAAIRKTFFVTGSALASLSWNALCSLAVAFGGKVGHAQAVGAIQDALESEGLPTDGIDAEVRRELVKGSAWSFGQCIREPNADELRYLKTVLQPDILSKTLAAFLADKTETTFPAVAEHLRAAGLIAAGKENIAENREVSGALVAAGWVQRTLGPRDRRYRAWVSPSWTPPPPARPALPVVTPGDIITANAPPVTLPFDPNRFDLQGAV